MPPSGTRLLSRPDVAAVLTLEDCIAAVEDAFRAHALGRALPTGVLGIHVAGGGFHIKAAGLGGDEPLFAAKVNGNFFENDRRFGLPRIQGLVVLCDARHGYPLAVMDSALITAVRTAAATAVAARHLARRDARVVTVAGCGIQGRAQLRAIAAVRQITHAFAYDTDPARAQAYAAEMRAALGFPVEAVEDRAAAVRRSDIVVTCTPARHAFLHAGDVRPGTLVAAVGADSESKQEIAPDLLRSSVVVPDLLEQAATIGDLHHAIEAGVMTRADVRAELGQVVAGLAEGRRNDAEIVIFDSTGTALQDVAAAALVYARAARRNLGVVLDLAGPGQHPPNRNPLLNMVRGWL
jgi:ornithine cyclodeaminase/alanine dehydrogenase-like protein (mu-crystallin family)